MDETLTTKIRDELEAGAGPERIKELAIQYDEWADEIFAFAKSWHSHGILHGRKLKCSP